MPEAQTSSGDIEVNSAAVKGMISAQVGRRQLLVLEVDILEGSPRINPP